VTAGVAGSVVTSGAAGMPHAAGSSGASGANAGATSVAGSGAGSAGAGEGGDIGSSGASGEGGAAPEIGGAGGAGGSDAIADCVPHEVPGYSVELLDKVASSDAVYCSWEYRAESSGTCSATPAFPWDPPGLPVCSYWGCASSGEQQHGIWRCASIAD